MYLFMINTHKFNSSFSFSCLFELFWFVICSLNHVAAANDEDYLIFSCYCKKIKEQKKYSRNRIDATHSSISKILRISIYVEVIKN